MTTVSYSAYQVASAKRELRKVAAELIEQGNRTAANRILDILETQLTRHRND